jgi:hypothetical protein
MKQRWTIIILILLAGSLLAQHKIGVTVGGNYWLTMMDYSVEFNVTERSAGGVEVPSEHLFGPMLNLRFGQLHLRGSYTMGTFDFTAIGDIDKILDKFAEEDDHYYDMLEEVYDQTDRDTYYALRLHDYITSFSRNEINASIGYMLSQNLLLFAAYKNIRYSWKETDINYDLYEYIPDPDPFKTGTYNHIPNPNGTDDTFTSPYSKTENLHFFGPGLKLDLPFGRLPFAFEATATYYFPSKKANSEITSIMGMFSYYAPFGLTASIGYHAQLRSLPDEGHYEKTTHGPFATLSFTLGFLED